MTRRETLVAFLRGTDGFSGSQLSAAMAVPGTTEFLARAQDRGISNADLADALVQFKANGGSGLQNAINSITSEWDAADAPVQAESTDGRTEAIQAALSAFEAGVAALKAAL